MTFKVQRKSLLQGPGKDVFTLEQEGWSEKNSPHKLYFNAECGYTIYNSKQEIISQNEVELKEELWEYFSDEYYVETHEKGVKVQKLYITKAELIDIFKIGLEKLEKL